MPPIRALVISDTHIPDQAPALPNAVLSILNEVDCVFHLGDFVTLDVLTELEALKKTYAVYGNCDPFEVRARLDDERILELNGAKIGLWHGSGGPNQLPDKVYKKFPDVDVALFGHSHLPLIEQRGKTILLNPGSATDSMRSKRKTYAILNIGETIEAKIVDLP